MIRPVTNLDGVLANIQDQTNADGYIYPPSQHTVIERTGEPLRKVPKSDRPALYYYLPATHEIEVASTLPEVNPRRGILAYLMHLFGFLLGHRCQFHDWRFDTRISIAAITDCLPPSPRQFTEIMNAAVSRWSRFSELHRTVATNIFYVHSRAVVLELDWERFLFHYMAFDAAYSVADALGDVHSNSHSDRFREVVARYGIANDPARFQQIVATRNSLMHQALWNDRMPGEAATHESHAATLWLSGITKRLALAILGLSGAYIRSPWWDMLTHFPDIDLPAA